MSNIGAIVGISVGSVLALVGGAVALVKLRTGKDPDAEPEVGRYELDTTPLDRRDDSQDDGQDDGQDDIRDTTLPFPPSEEFYAFWKETLLEKHATRTAQQRYRPGSMSNTTVCEDALQGMTRDPKINPALEDAKMEPSMDNILSRGAQVVYQNDKCAVVLSVKLGSSEINDGLYLNVTVVMKKVSPEPLTQFYWTEAWKKTATFKAMDNKSKSVVTKVEMKATRQDVLNSGTTTDPKSCLGFLRCLILSVKDLPNDGLITLEAWHTGREEDYFGRLIQMYASIGFTPYKTRPRQVSALFRNQRPTV